MSGMGRIRALRGLAVVMMAGHAMMMMPLASLGVSDARADCSSSPGKGVEWQDCRKRNLIVSGYDFTDANFSRADLSSSDLRDTTLVNANFEKANIVRASLSGSDASGANFNGVIASRTNFSEVNLANADLGKAEIIRGDFSDSILKDIDMSKGEFFRSEFNGATMGNVDFSYSNLARSDFRGVTLNAPVDMTNAFLFLTRLDDLDISFVTGLKAWQLEMACGNENTILPEGLERPESWPCNGEEDD